MNLTQLGALTPMQLAVYLTALAAPPLFGMALLYLAFMAQPRLQMRVGVWFLTTATALSAVGSFLVLYDVPPWWARWAVAGAIVAVCVAHALVVRHRLRRLRAARTHRGEHHP